jgi:hypothetical protein
MLTTCVSILETRFFDFFHDFYKVQTYKIIILLDLLSKRTLTLKKERTDKWIWSTIIAKY